MVATHFFLLNVHPENLGKMIPHFDLLYFFKRVTKKPTNQVCFFLCHQVYVGMFFFWTGHKEVLSEAVKPKWKGRTNHLQKPHTKKQRDSHLQGGGVGS